MPDAPTDTFLGDLFWSPLEIEWAKPSGAPAALSTVRVTFGHGSGALEVALASANAAPRTDDVRRLWSSRWARRAAPVVLGRVSHIDRL